jgi:hypothetical protein
VLVLNSIASTYSTGVHRELGAHISNIVCLELDGFENEDLIEHILRIGNKVANQNWLARVWWSCFHPDS